MNEKLQIKSEKWEIMHNKLQFNEIIYTIMWSFAF